MPQTPPRSKPKTRHLLGGVIFFSLTTLGLVALGTWQWGRAQTKDLWLDQAAHAQAGPSASFTPGQSPRLWQNLTLSGTFDTSRETVLESQRGPDGETVGYRIITPFLTADGAHEVLVDRGWIPRDFTPGFLTRYQPTVNLVSGVVREFPERRGWLTGATTGYGASLTLLFFDPQAIPTKANLKRENFYLQASTATHPQVQALVASADGGISPARHREYAYTWWACALLWLATGLAYGVSVLRAPRPSLPKASSQTGLKAAARRGKPKRSRQ